MVPVTLRTYIGTILAKQFRREYYAQRGQQSSAPQQQQQQQ